MLDLPVIERKSRNVPPLSEADQKRLLRQMMLIRNFENQAMELFRQGLIKGSAHSSVGQEAISAGACSALDLRDFVMTHHRGHGHCIAKGASLPRMMAELMGRVDGYSGGLGGSMHIADLKLNILGANGIVGAGIGLSLGAALAAQQCGDGGIGIVFFGDGAANEGVFHETVNLAAVKRLPLILFCENNLYGVSTQMRAVTAGGSIANRAAGYGIPGEKIDGNDLIQVYEIVAEAAARARAGEGPTLIEAMTYRWGDHSMRAKLPNYRASEEEEAWRARDPVAFLGRQLGMDESAMKQMADEVAAEVDAAVVYGKASVEPASEVLAPAVVAPIRRVEPQPAPGARLLSYTDAVAEAISQEMQRDPSVFIIGQDIARIGGVFGSTRGLLEKFGPERVIDSPISEQAIAGAAIGAAMMGRRAIAEVQFFDFVTLMMDMIVNQAAKYRFMLGGKPSLPVVIRGPQGSGVRLAAQHSQSLEAWFAHVPGLVVLAPSTPYDAKGLLIAAIRDDNPVLVIEHKKLYLGPATPVPEAPYELQIGRAEIKRTGTDVTLVASLSMVAEALRAADQLASEGLSAEVIDLRTLRPLDMDTILASVRKTNRCVIVHEAWRTGGLGGEIAAEISEKAFDSLDAPVMRLGAVDVPTPYNDRLERAVVPDAKAIADAARTVAYLGTRN